MTTFLLMIVLILCLFAGYNIYKAAEIISDLKNDIKRDLEKRKH